MNISPLYFQKFNHAKSIVPQETEEVKQELPQGSGCYSAAFLETKLSWALFLTQLFSSFNARFS